MLRFVASEWSRRSRRSARVCSERASNSSRCDFTALEKHYLFSVIHSESYRSSPFWRVSSNSRSEYFVWRERSLISYFSRSAIRVLRASAFAASICLSRAEESFFLSYHHSFLLPLMLCCRSSARIRHWFVSLLAISSSSVVSSSAF